MKLSSPLISCICITVDRPIVLQRALTCFERQDYPNTELVISYPEDDLLTKMTIDRVSEISTFRIIRIERFREEDMALTMNDAINAANGKYICLWNHEHWHHASRISDQYRVLKRGPFMASILMHVLLFDFNRQQTYHSDYHSWEETLLCEKEVLLQANQNLAKSTIHASRIHFLSSRNILYHIQEAPHLYIYIYYDYQALDTNFSSMLLNSETMPEINQTIKEILNLDYYSLGPI